MISINLKEFLLKGRIGALSFGLCKDDVHKLLGDPDACSEPRNRSAIWKYGALELHFQEQDLAYIGLYFREHSGSLPKQITLLDFCPTNSTRIVEIIRYLNENEISFQIEPIMTYHESFVLRISNEVCVHFDLSDDSIDSISCSFKPK